MSSLDRQLYCSIRWDELKLPSSVLRTHKKGINIRGNPHSKIPDEHWADHRFTRPQDFPSDHLSSASESSAHGISEPGSVASTECTSDDEHNDGVFESLSTALSQRLHLSQHQTPDSDEDEDDSNGFMDDKYGLIRITPMRPHNNTSTRVHRRTQDEVESASEKRQRFREAGWEPQREDTTQWRKHAVSNTFLTALQHYGASYRQRPLVLKPNDPAPMVTVIHSFGGGAPVRLCIVHQGWLKKRSKNLKVWRWRWVVLTHNCLATYKEQMALDSLSNPTMLLPLTAQAQQQTPQLLSPLITPLPSPLLTPQPSRVAVSMEPRLPPSLISHALITTASPSTPPSCARVELKLSVCKGSDGLRFVMAAGTTECLFEAESIDQVRQWQRACVAMRCQLSR